jgi:hypothetical protein
MDGLGHVSDADLDRLLAGKAQSGAADVEALATFFHEVKSRYVTQPSSATRQDHLSKIVAAAQLNAEQMYPSIGSEAGPTGVPDKDPGRRPRWRKRLVLGGIFGSITAKIALLGVVAATAATGGLAAAGSLPNSLQSAVAGAAGNVGVRLPNPQATAEIRASAQAEAGKVASAVDRIVEQVTIAAQQPTRLTTSTVASTQTCTQNVSTIASQLLNSAAGASNPALAQSLAERATALAQESVGCALPAIGAAGGSGATNRTDTDARDTAAAKAISGAVQGCAAPLRSAIETLVRAAIMAKTSAQLQALAQNAKAVATAAQSCAQGLGSALQAVLSTLPAAAPTTPAGTMPTPTPTSSNGWSGFMSLMPNLPKMFPTVAPTPGGTAPKGTASDNPAAWWTQFLSQLPSQAPKTGSGAPGDASPGSGSWSGLTGSWNGSGSWSPYPSSPPASPEPKHNHNKGGDNRQNSGHD